jgi:hypothetical protein
MKKWIEGCSNFLLESCTDMLHTKKWNCLSLFMEQRNKKKILRAKMENVTKESFSILKKRIQIIVPCFLYFFFPCQFGIAMKLFES